MAAATETQAEREARWWAAWFEADYSWEGLAGHEIKGGGLYGEATLQDYWRRDPETGRGRTDAALKRIGELVEFDGRWWHLAHLPLHDREYVEVSWKEDAGHPNWVRLDALVTSRLTAAKETAGPSRYLPRPLSGLDGRARLDGAVVRLIEPHHPFQEEGTLLHLSCMRAWIDATDQSILRFGNGACFDWATFADDVSFGRVTFSGYASFDRVTFFGDADFDGVTFSDEVSFDGATFFGGGGFEGATFSSYTSFRSVTFLDYANFGGATFSIFIRFDLAVFCGYTGFNGVVFSGYAHFFGVNFLGEARFDGATFSSNANFDEVTFSGYTVFDSVTFERQWHFSGEFKLTAAVTFKGAVFKGPATFVAKIEAPETSFRRAFYAARFLDIADFSGAVGPDDAGRMACAFVETQFEKALVLTDGSERHAREGFRKRVKPAIARSRRYRRLRAVRRNRERKQAGRRYVSPWRYRIDCVRLYVLHRIRLLFLPEKEFERDARLRDLEAGCRTVKIAMGKARDELREQRYYRFQLRARLMRSDIDVWEKIFGFVYRVTSDFGSSLVRPLAGIVIATAVFGYGYAVWGGSLADGRFEAAPSRDHLFEGQGVALSALKPFSTVEAPKSSVKESGGQPPGLVAVLTANPAVTLGLRLATAVQVIVSTLLLFLFGLAVKRRFQIS